MTAVAAEHLHLFSVLAYLPNYKNVGKEHFLALRLERNICKRATKILSALILNSGSNAASLRSLQMYDL